jgi:glutathione S-transferase
MKILGSQTSPFVRSVRALCEELNIDYTLEEVPFYKKMTPEQAEIVNRSNPLMKVPVLIDEGQTILDSRIITNYLLQNHKQDLRPKDPINLEEENLITVLSGILDAGILRFIMGKEDVPTDSGYLARSMERMQAGFEYLENSPALGQKFGIPELLLVCVLEWTKKREVYDWSAHENLVRIHQKFKDRDSLAKTRIPENA